MGRLPSCLKAPTAQHHSSSSNSSNSTRFAPYNQKIGCSVVAGKGGPNSTPILLPLQSPTSPLSTSTSSSSVSSFFSSSSSLASSSSSSASAIPSHPESSSLSSSASAPNLTATFTISTDASSSSTSHFADSFSAPSSPSGSLSLSPSLSPLNSNPHSPMISSSPLHSPSYLNSLSLSHSSLSHSSLPHSQSHSLSPSPAPLSTSLSASLPSAPSSVSSIVVSRNNSPPTSPISSTPEPLTCLLAEDNEVNRILMEKMLNKLGISTLIALNGMEALELAQKHKFDLILMDIMMPVLDGFESTRLIRNASLNKDTTIVAVTTMDLTKKDFQCGLNDHLSKPFTTSKLKRVIEKHFS